MPHLDILPLGRRPYEDVWALQKKLAAERAAGMRPDTLILVEHPPVYTRGTSARSLLAPSLPYPVWDVERGGDVTFHGEGQLVGYPIIHLKERNLLVGTYLRQLESILINTLQGFGVAASRSPGRTGVWCGARKVASIGVAVRGWVTYHGFSLNVRGDLLPYQAIRPCGFAPEVMTSVSRILQRDVCLEELSPLIENAFQEAFTPAHTQKAEILCTQ